jgi:hypothetical protein
MMVLAFKKLPKEDPSYEILEPETWIGRELPILEHVDIGKQFKEGSCVSRINGAVLATLLYLKSLLIIF